MNEYSYMPIPSYINDELVVLMNNGQYRTCIKRSDLDYSSLWYTDCIHPAQNALVDQNSIVKWKLKELNPAS